MHNEKYKMLREVGLQDSDINNKGLHLVIHDNNPRLNDREGGLQGFKLVVQMGLELIQHRMKLVAWIDYFINDRGCNFRMLLRG